MLRHLTTDWEAYLREPVSYSRWGEATSPEQAAQARNAIKEVLRRAKTLFPHAARRSTTPEEVSRYTEYFLTKLLRLKTELHLGNWNAACNRLEDVLHFFQVHDRRFLFLVIKLLEEYV